MTRKIALVSVLVTTLMASGCVSWQDRAGAEALAACAGKADPDERRQCRSGVVAAAEADYREQIDALQQSIDAAEERERLRKVYGGPREARN